MADATKPSDAIRELVRTVSALPFDANPGHVRDDVIALRQAFTNDAAFATALRAIVNALRRLAQRPDSGQDLEHGLAGWRRIRFRSRSGDGIDLRIIFRAVAAPPGDRIELRAFGHRHSPESVYYRSLKRG